MVDPQTNDTTDPQRTRAYADYVHDQLQQVRSTTDHAAVLQQQAPDRIAGAKQAMADAKQPALGAKTTVDQSVDQYHVVERMLDERAFYPPHDKRTESPAYAKVHHQMTVVDDKRCLVCGVKHSTLGDAAQNPFGAIQMETHHHTIEWALANAIVPDKFNQHIRPGLERLAQARVGAQLPAVYTEFDAAYASPMDAKTITEWVDHAADNLWVLCDVHHRHKFVGIHAITFPIWGPQDVVDQTTVADEIAAVTGKTTTTTTTPPQH